MSEAMNLVRQVIGNNYRERIIQSVFEILLFHLCTYLLILYRYFRYFVVKTTKPQKLSKHEQMCSRVQYVGISPTSQIVCSNELSIRTHIVCPSFPHAYKSTRTELRYNFVGEIPSFQRHHVDFTRSMDTAGCKCSYHHIYTPYGIR